MSKNDHDVFELWEAAFDYNRESLRNFESGCTDGEQGFPPNFLGLQEVMSKISHGFLQWESDMYRTRNP